LDKLRDYPLLVFTLTLVSLCLSEWIGSLWRKKRNLEEDERKSLEVIEAATLTLLGLIIGFSFSMAISRYDQRKNYEEEEANAIGTEYVQAELLPAIDAGRIKTLLQNYLGQRVAFYETHDDRQLERINDYTAQLETELSSRSREYTRCCVRDSGGCVHTGENSAERSCHHATLPGHRRHLYAVLVAHPNLQELLLKAYFAAHDSECPPQHR
jgi:hypothetical protein